jgi:protein-L-isoaspartate O-methyltransferase
VDGVEIDGELTRVGRELFGLGGPNVHLHTADARPFLRGTKRRFDAIFVDAYHQPYIPFYLATREFFQLVRDRLRPGGSVVVNVGHPAGDQHLEQVLSSTMRAVFRTVVRDPSEDVNSILLATDATASRAALRAATPALAPELQTVARTTASRLAPGLRGGRVYTDDVAPVEWLVDASLVKVAADGRRTP